MSLLIYDLQYQDLAFEAAVTYEIERSPDQPKLAAAPPPFRVHNGRSISRLSLHFRPLEPLDNYPYWPVKDTDTLFIHHTSGTSGMPKPLPQDSHQSLHISAHLSSGPSSPTFTTTPLYHGGLPDIFRAWATDAMIWLFSAKDMPITAANVIKSLQVAQKPDWGKDRPSIPPPRYFSSVPFVLQMVTAEEEGFQLLKGMDVVGVGGAPLASHVGDDLVKRGIKLVSRFGSAECGCKLDSKPPVTPADDSVLLCSHRDYEKDQEWQYLRAEHGLEHIKFEPQGDGTFELVVLPGWPRMVGISFIESMLNAKGS